MSKTTKKEKQNTCGLVMPISAIDGYSADHWLDVKKIITEAISASDFNFEIRLVSDADDIGVIQKRIVQSLYDSDIVICDVSAKNPNVMFELGMRLAFDKPTVIIKDDKTDYIFDTGVIEHIVYPKDLRFYKIVEFQENLKLKVEATYKASKENTDYSSFLKNFGKFTIANLSEDLVPADKAILSSINELQNEMTLMRRAINFENRSRNLKLHGMENGSISFKASEVARMRRFIVEWAMMHKLNDVKDLIGDEIFYEELYEFSHDNFGVKSKRELVSVADSIIMNLSLI